MNGRFFLRENFRFDFSKCKVLEWTKTILVFESTITQKTQNTFPFDGIILMIIAFRMPTIIIHTDLA